MWVARVLRRLDEYMRWRTCRVARPRTPRSCFGFVSKQVAYASLLVAIFTRDVASIVRQIWWHWNRHPNFRRGIAAGFYYIWVQSHVR